MSEPYYGSLTIDLMSDLNQATVIQQLITDSFIIDSINYEADVYLQPDEFSYLTGFREGMKAQAADIEKACYYLKRKHKFQKVTFIFQPSSRGVQLRLILEGLWTLKRVKFQGLLTGKENYRQYYLLEPGEIFDIKKHYDSLERIKQAFKEQGYIAGYATDYLEFHRETKTLTAHIILEKGHRFRIKDIEWKFECDEQDIPDNALKEKLASKFNTRFLKKYYLPALINSETSALKKYLIKKGYVNAVIMLQEFFNYNRNTVKLIFSIALHKKKKIIFFGNHFFLKRQLFNVLYGSGHLAGLLPESLLAEELEKMYYNKGFWQTKIEVCHENDFVYFLIDEGKRSRIAHVELRGADHIDTKTMRHFFSPLTSLMHFDIEVQKKSLSDLTAWYLQRGFWDVRILKQEYVFDSNADNYTLIITLDEGTCRYIRSVTVDGFSELTRELVKQDNLEGNIIPFDINLLKKHRDYLLEYFHKAGYLYVQITHELIADDKAISVVWHISGVDQKVTFGKIVVQGSYTFPFRYIMRELCFSTGEIWQRDKLEQSLRKLRDLSIFESIYISPYKVTENEFEKPVLIKLFEDEPFEVKFRAGFQQVSKNLTFRSGSTYKLGGSVLYKNPGNCGDCLRFDCDFTRFYRTVSGYYQRPWIFGLPVQGILKGYSNKYIQPVMLGSDKPLYQAIQQGVLCGLNRRWNHHAIGINIGFEFMETNDLSVSLARAINFNPKLIDKKVPYSYVESNILIDFLDNQLNPTRGILTVISGKAMIPWDKKGVNFLKILAEQSLFFSIKSVVCGMRFRVGHIFNQKFSEIMPPERFYLGGAFSIRSYQPDFAPPLGIFIDEKGKSRLVPRGGKTMVNTNLEIRFPLLWQIGGVIFQDLGTLIEHSMSHINGGKFLTATGFGLRYNTPIGPLRFDIGWKWFLFDPEESRFACFFTLGQAF